MCGISGYYTTQQLYDADAIIKEILYEQHYRGPDHCAIETIKSADATISFGHNRLSIIDLSHAADQPMWDTERRYCLTYNGEIYNYIELKAELVALGHRFITQSDSEVILEAVKAWGIPEALGRFNGMFAFALVDRQTQTLWLIRDRFGVKPLFYYCDNDRIFFASSAKVIARHMRLAPNLEYIARGLRYWLYEDDSDISPYKDLHALPSGTYLQVSLNADKQMQVIQHRYYDLQARVSVLREELNGNSAHDLLEMVGGYLERAVEFRLRSDVPVGVSLSGGVDSSAVAATLAKQNAQVIGFTFGSPDDSKSEGPIVEELRKKLGIRVIYVAPSLDEIIQDFWNTLEAQGAPFAGRSPIAQFSVYRVAHAHGIKVLLGGQGGDEAFMGYRKFPFFWWQQLIHEKQYCQATAFTLNHLLVMMIAELRRMSLFWQYRYRYTKAGLRTNLRLPDPIGITIGTDIARVTWRRQLYDVTRYSLPTLLRYEDRNSMRNSIESRLPFLDYHLVELGLALPESLKLKAGYGKWAVREVMRGILPESIRAARYKYGFEVNRSHWIEGGLGRAIREKMHEQMPRIREWLQPNVNLEHEFSNRHLIERPLAFEEAVTLLWLGHHSL